MSSDTYISQIAIPHDYTKRNDNTKQTASGNAENL